MDSHGTGLRFEASYPSALLVTGRLNSNVCIPQSSRCAGKGSAFVKPLAVISPGPSGAPPETLLRGSGFVQALASFKASLRDFFQAFVPPRYQEDFPSPSETFLSAATSQYP